MRSDKKQGKNNFRLGDVNKLWRLDYVMMWWWKCWWMYNCWLHKNISPPPWHWRMEDIFKSVPQLFTIIYNCPLWWVILQTVNFLLCRLHGWLYITFPWFHGNSCRVSQSGRSTNDSSQFQSSFSQLKNSVTLNFTVHFDCPPELIASKYPHLISWLANLVYNSAKISQKILRTDDFDIDLSYNG